MKFEIDYFDGKPSYVRTDNGFCQTGGAYDEQEHGWMLDQLDPRDFPEIQTGRRVAALVNEINELRRENWELKRNEKQWLTVASRI